MAYRMYDLIEKKRDGGRLDQAEIKWMIDEYVAGNIPDYQMSAMTMAIFFRGLDKEETLNLTMAMTESGDTVDLSGIEGIKVDKHSTGGVGDKTSIALAPLVASVGVKVAKMSGRGLGHTGGTIDKLESFPGFNTSISMDAFLKQVNEIGISIMGQTKDLVPADKKLYALRDVTATVDQLSLIASSIMSKKLASGADAIVLDVKCGSGAFMKNYNDAKALAEEMAELGRGAGRKVTAFITDMDEPLGLAVGNALEVKEAIDTLKGKGPEDFSKLVMELASAMVYFAGLAEDEEAAKAMLKKTIEEGAAIAKLKEFVKAQGGDERAVDDSSLLPTAQYEATVTADTDGYIKRIECSEVGTASLLLGGGRLTKEDVIDLSTGIIMKKKKGDAVKSGEALAVIYYNDEDKKKAAEMRLKAAFEISSEKPEKNDIILGRI